MCTSERFCNRGTTERLRYDKTSLLRLKHTSAALNRLRNTTFNCINKLGLLKPMRGRRAGSHVHRRIPAVSVFRDPVLKVNSPMSPRFLHNIDLNQTIPNRPISDLRPLLPCIFMTNARSLNNKIEELEVMISSNKVDIAVITETWFTEATAQIANISNFTTFSKSRTTKRGGGVAVFAKDHLSTHELPNHNCEYECLWVKLKSTRSKPIKRSSIAVYVGVIYYPPSSIYHREILEHISHTVDDIRASDMSAVIMIMGDFNDLKCDPFEADLGMTQLISFPTRGNATLDKIYTNFPAVFNDPVRMSPTWSQRSLLCTPNSGV